MLKVSVFLKIVKLTPESLIGYYMQQKAVRWESKTCCGNVACQTSTTIQCQLAQPGLYMYIYSVVPLLQIILHNSGQICLDGQKYINAVWRKWPIFRVFLNDSFQFGSLQKQEENYNNDATALPFLNKLCNHNLRSKILFSQ